MQRRILAVLFDLDDTLLDWTEWSGSFAELSKRQLGRFHDELLDRGHTVPDKEAFVRSYVELLVRCWDEAKLTWAGVRFADVLSRYLNELGLDQSQVDLDELLLTFDYGPLPGVAPYEDAVAVLDLLKQEEYLIGLITNSMFPMWMRDIELRAYDMIEYFDVRLTSGDVGYMKPHPAIYQQALNELGVAADQAVFVGDRPVNDISGAIEAGLVAILMAPPSLNRDLEGVEPHFTISCLSELPPILRALESEDYEKAGTK